MKPNAATPFVTPSDTVREDEKNRFIAVHLGAGVPDDRRMPEHLRRPARSADISLERAGE